MRFFLSGLLKTKTFTKHFLPAYLICCLTPLQFTCIESNASILPLIGFRINDGAKYTNQTEVYVEIKSMKLGDSLIAQMKIGTDPSLANVSWMDYTEQKIKISLSEGDGEKFIYAQLKDVAGNISPVESAKIIMDTASPSDIEILINNGDKYSGDEQRRVLVYIRSGEKDLEEMMFSNQSNLSDGKWEPMAGTKKWILDATGGDGEKHVYARFRDSAGNVSEIFHDEIILDTKPPQHGSIVINDNARFTKSGKVKLKIQAQEAAMVRIVSSGKSETIPYTVSEGKDFMEVNWQLDSAEGTKIVRVYFMDEAKNRTSAIIQDEIIFDRSGPPMPFISINGDQRYTNNPEGKVNLRLVTKVNPSNITMMVSNTMDFNDAQPQNFRDIINNWQLPAEEDGMKTVYVKYIDEAGNHSQIGMAKIILDRVSPKINSIKVNEGSSWATSVKVNINMDVEDVSHMQVSNTTAISNITAWERFEPTKIDWTLIPGDGKKTIYLRFKDEANNISEIVETQVTLDTQPPKGEVIINNGDRFVNHPEKLVTIQIKSEDAKGIQVSNKPDFSEIKLEPFKNIIEDWILEGDDGIKTVFIRLRDEAGNFSNVLTASVILDRIPPQELNMVINEGMDWLTNSAGKAPIQLSAKGASHFMVSEDPEFNQVEWENFRNVTTWKFSEAEGEKTLYARFKDPAGNISESISEKIKLDYTPPICDEFSINDGADFCNDPQKKVTLTIKSVDAMRMAISNSTITDPNSPSIVWEEYTERKEWTLDGEDGLKTINLVLSDKAGNFSMPYSDRIILDRAGPSNPTVIVNANMKYVPPGGLKVPLELSAEGADKVFISEDPDFNTGRWELFVPKKLYEVSEGDGPKNLYIKFRDKAMNETPVLNYSVILDTKPPKAIAFTINNGEQYTKDPKKLVTLNIETEEAVEMRLVQKGHPPGDWEPYASEKQYVLLGEDGEKEIGIAFRDEAGNISKPINAKIVLDRTPPQPESLVIDNGQGWTNDPNKKVTLNIKAEGAAEMAIGTDPSLKNISWQPYISKLSDFELPGGDGEKIIFIRFRDAAGNVSNVISSKVNLKRSF